MDDLIAEFLTETNESLNDLDTDLVNLEQNPNDKDLLGQIFRIVHTIKGTCGFLGLPRLEGVAHKGEDLLGLFRDGTVEVTPAYVTLIFDCLDRIKEIIEGIEQTGSEPEGDDSTLIKTLEDAYNNALNGGGPEEEEAVEKTPQQELDEAVKKAREQIAAEQAATAATEAPADDTAADATPADDIIGEDIFVPVPGPDFSAEPAEAPEEDGAEPVMEDAPVEAAPAPEPAPAPKPAAPAATKTEPSPAAKPAAKEAPVATQSLRVNVDVLENLMTMVSELVLTRNQLLQILRTQHESEFTTPLQRLNHVVSDLQEGVMKTRMQPIGNAWAKLPRIIRDISIDLGKKIDLEMRGQDTELDRQVLDMIKDPLTHMVRNSADHGIETPAERAAAGKPETGKLLLNAYHEGGHIIIEINDDGKGLNTDRIKEKILANGLATEDELAEMSNQQIHMFIFKAGFSTAEKITAVSGRGVGMDVVRTNIEKIGGSIELKSEEGKGSRFLIKIPLTLAIVSALIVESGGERFAIPQLVVRELVMASTEGENRIETIKGTPVFRLRDHLLPLVTLSKLLKLETPKNSIIDDVIAAAPKSDADKTEKADGDAEVAASDAGDKKPSGNTNDGSNGHEYIVVTQVGAYSFGIIVDRVFDTEEIVVKPVANILRDIEMFSGNTILGDGSVIMILDPAGIAKCTGDIEGPDQNEAAEEEAKRRARAREKTTLLLFSAGGAAPKTVPLELISRLEEINVSDIETANGQSVIQYRGQLMPLLPFNSGVQISAEGTKPVLVFADEHRSMGIIVDEIIDILEEYVDVQMQGSQGIVGSAIIDGKATEVIDVGHYLEKAGGDWFKNHADEPFETGGTKENLHAKKRALLVEDSPFFRNMLAPILGVSGYHVTTAENALVALDLCEAGERFDVIISDIEMPEMTGFEFVEKIKDGTIWQDTPIIALSSHTTPQDMERGTRAGFDRYIGKFNREVVLDTLSQLLNEKMHKSEETEGENA